MDNLLGLGSPALWALAVGFFSPPVISVIQQSRWSTRTRSLVAFVFYLVLAAVTAYLAGAFTGGDFVKIALIVFVMASVSYQHLWRPTGVSPAIESATSNSAPATLDSTPAPRHIPTHLATRADPAAPRPPDPINTPEL